MYNKTILYAEDDTESRENYTYILKKIFQNVYSVTNGEEALQIYRNFTPDIVLLDISMPKIDGLEVAKIIRENDYKTHIIMFTAYSDKVRLMKAVNLKLDGYLLKPVDDELLISEITKLMDIVIQDSQNLTIRKDLIWNKTKKSLFYKNTIIEMTKKEKLLFECLLTNVGAYIHRAYIIDCVWEDEFEDETHAQKLTQLAYRLNKKILQETNLEVPIIQASYSFGYKIVFE